MPDIISPPGWKKPKGYANGVVASGRLLAIAGQVGWDAQERVVSPDFAPQFAQALDNVLAVARTAGGRAEDIVSMTVFVTDKAAYLAATPALAPIWRERLGRHYPAMALVEVAGLIEPGALVEIQALAVLP